MEDQRLRSALGPGPDCPSIQRLAYFVDGLLPIAELQADEAHIATCANCRAELVLLHVFMTSTISDEDGLAMKEGLASLRRREAEIFGPIHGNHGSWKKWFSPVRLQPVLALAAVLLAVGIGYYMRGSGVPAFPSVVGSGTEVTRSMRVHLLEPAGDQTTVPGRLAWQPLQGATGYHVRLMEVDRQEIWSTDSTVAAVDLPADVQARISPAKTLEWQVTAYGADRTPIAQSDSQRFRLMK
jgi:hypothetical protein